MFDLPYSSLNQWDIEQRSNSFSKYILQSLISFLKPNTLCKKIRVYVTINAMKRIIKKIERKKVLTYSFLFIYRAYYTRSIVREVFLRILGKFKNIRRLKKYRFYNFSNLNKKFTKKNLAHFTIIIFYFILQYTCSWGGW